ncbi:probable WRKY transcription factor 2 [Phalaenopsis equestris]|uniref:probable WRKY transcription factor 2 n=1 Tax=Phalaenopsis equestris TaxID=78828 RepID=UPI0009E20913|nr:probable WRKY transcription factor 2 [Phalaenopsis equestris]XP_020588297.1 probable WRKY transcription factor 2 [Phalaenopsis equestris]XP_020588299.1 probable WRKY transcription factor 2 [Phalaenopsis equestris]XP_020588300.1 probable WRKY transcription factor 2 [Phalaenopsis equestris]
MAGIDDKFSIFEEWGTFNPSPITFIPFHDLGDGGHLGSTVSENEKTALDYKEEVKSSASEPYSDIFSGTVQFKITKSSSRGALSERIAARAGFSTLTVNTSRNGTENVISSPSDKISSCLVLSPGLSPTAFLESPVLLSNSMAEPSPTTGKLPFAHTKDNTSFSTLISEETYKNNVQKIEEFCDDAFTFPRLCSDFPFLSNAKNKFVSSINQRQSETKENAEETKADSFLGNECSPSDENHYGGTDPKGESSSMPVIAPEEDGYNWRKYGQKHVKGSEFPRSYYKCTFLNCPVKKKVERSLEGHVTEIIYRGAHNHPKPPSNRRPCATSSHSFSDTQVEGSDYQSLNSEFDGNLSLLNSENGNVGSGWRRDAMEAASSVASVAEFATSNSMQTQSGSRYSGSEVMHLSSAMSNDEEDDGATNGCLSVRCDAEGEERDPKRSKLDLCSIDMSAASRAMREPRVVVQTTSEVDILDDGYRWRKYGQKVVKGNPNPRSYYKCTNPGCTVRKHVERASHDLKSVITTYEGKHDHDVPAAKTSNNQNSGSSNTATIGMQQPHNSFHGRAEEVQESFRRLQSDDPFALPCGAPQLRVTAEYGAYAIGFGQEGMVNLGIGGLGPMKQMKMPGFSPLHPYLEQQRRVDGEFIVPNDLPTIPNARNGFYQFSDRLPLGTYL